MLNINHILFPIDFSRRCCDAVPFVKSMADRYRSRVTLLSVAQPFYFAAAEGPPIPVDTEELRRDLQARLANSFAKDFSNLQVERVAELGDPAKAITEFAHAHAVDLIMMPTHGYGPFRSMLLGSVTAKVLHDAKCPVWTAAHVSEPPWRAHIAPRNILCAVDGTSKSIALLKWAGELAKSTGADLRLVHVMPTLEGTPAHMKEFEDGMREEASQKIERLQESADVNAPLCVIGGHVAEGVCEEARRHGTDMVLIGRGSLNEPFGRLRTHSYAIIRQSPCPVLSV